MSYHDFHRYGICNLHIIYFHHIWKIYLTTTYKEQYKTQPTAQQQSISDDRVEFNISFQFNWLLLYPLPKKKETYIYTEILAKNIQNNLYNHLQNSKNIRIIIYTPPPHIPITKKTCFSPSPWGFCCQSQVTKVNSATKRFVSPANKISLMAWWSAWGFWKIGTYAKL